MAAEVAQHDVASVATAAAVAVVIILLLPLVAEVLLQARLAQIHVLQFGVVHQILSVTAVCAEAPLLRRHSVIVRFGVQCLLREELLQMGQMEMIRQSHEELHVL